jgi:hypothetical protein
MSSRITIVLMTLLCLSAALNAFALLPNVSRAAVGGMSHQELLRDPDFTRAVKAIAEQCSVNIDLGKLKC